MKHTETRRRSASARARASQFNAGFSMSDCSRAVEKGVASSDSELRLGPFEGGVHGIAHRRDSRSETEWASGVDHNTWSISRVVRHPPPGQSPMECAHAMAAARAAARGRGPAADDVTVKAKIDVRASLDACAPLVVV
ncbi:hypothetical protein HPB50_021965 [Hyalomma asiaticum]|uniref:Uncharacterized protein n=1 Tax=Hyalomma asiaticum TaxID=266040 RepID=A0ACB7TM53_HYAAI|nr:hypothetical protein HPB50_021965 [Hyalomma asiaticum]